jgi:hypothetical protein
MSSATCPGELFGLHKPHPSYSRLSRHDCTGLLWLLQGRRVVALTDGTAAIQNPTTGNVLTYRKTRKPAYGPLGDLLDDFHRMIVPPPAIAAIALLGNYMAGASQRQQAARAAHA